MAITQTIKIETEGADKAAEQFKAIGTAVEQSAEQIKKVGDASGGGFEKAEAAATKFGTKIQDLGATLGRLGIGDQIGGAVSKIGEAASTAAPAITQLKQAAVGAATGMAEFGKGLLTAFTSTSKTGEGLAVVASGLTKVGEAASKTAATAGNLGLALQAASVALGPFSGSLGSLVSILGVVGSALTTFAVAMPLVTSAIAAATPAIVAFVAALGSVALIIGGIVLVLGTVAAAFYFFGGAARENTAALTALSESTGRSVEVLKAHQDAFIAAGGSAKGYVAILQSAAATAAELGPKMAQMTRESAEAAKSATEKALEDEKKLIEAKKRLEALGGPRVSFQENVRLIDILRQQEQAAQPVIKAQREVEQTAVQMGASQAAAAQKTADAWGPLVEKMRAVAAGAKDVKFDSLTTAETKINAAKVALDEAEKSGTATNQTMQNLVRTLDGIDPGKISAAFKIPEDEVTKIQSLDQATQSWGQSLQEIAIRVGGLLRGLSTEEINQQIAALKPKLDEVGTSAAAAQTSVDAVGTSAAAAQTSIDAVGTSAAAAQTSVDVAATTPADGAWAWVSSTFDSVLKFLQDATAKATSFITTWVTTPVANAWTWLADSFKSVADAITAWFQERLAAWRAMFDRLRSSGSAGPGGNTAAAPAGAGLARGGLLGGRGSGTSDSNLAWVSRGEYIVPARIVQRPGVLALLEALRRSGRLTGHATGGLIPAYAGGGEVGASNFLSSLGSSLHQVFDIIVSAAKAGMDGSAKINELLKDVAFTTFDALNKIAMDLNESLKNVAFKEFDALNKVALDAAKQANSIDESLGKAADILQGLANSASKATSKAGGGLIGGRGSGISDSNLAWLSRGEYVVRADAVGRYGVGLFHALNNMIFPGFALGGLNIGMPRLAAAGFAGGGMNNVTIQFPGLPEITGLRAPSSVVDELRNAAAMAQVRSGGRKPSRYG